MTRLELKKWDLVRYYIPDLCDDLKKLEKLVKQSDECRKEYQTALREFDEIRASKEPQVGYQSAMSFFDDDNEQIDEIEGRFYYAEILMETMPRRFRELLKSTKKLKVLLDKSIMLSEKEEFKSHITKAHGFFHEYIYDPLSDIHSTLKQSRDKLMSDKVFETFTESGDENLTERLWESINLMRRLADSCDRLLHNLIALGFRLYSMKEDDYEQ